VATRLSLYSLGYILNISFIIFFHITKMCVEALLSHHVVLLLIAMHAIVIFPALTSLIALAIFDCVFYSVLPVFDAGYRASERTRYRASRSSTDRDRRNPSAADWTRVSDAGTARCRQGVTGIVATQRI